MSGREGAWRGTPPPEEMDAAELLRAVREAGGRVTVTEGGRLRFAGRRGVPPALVVRAAELADAIREELGPPGRCGTCAGRLFYLRGGRWRCLSCRGLPAGEEVPETWARAEP